MVFHGDYEIEFEIHKDRLDDWRTDYLGHMPGMTAQEALARWLDQHHTEEHEVQRLRAIPVMTGVKV
tara:strand:+ start:7651 stop:7851 length:201 start_codon:yes stop_codon:yes gene_type:complete